MESETKGHKILKKTIRKILENCDFDLLDTEVNIDIDSDGDPEFSIDVCSVHNKTLLVFQCKDRETITAPKKEFNSTKEYMRKVLSKKFKVLESDQGVITDQILKKITDIKCCYAFTKKLTNYSLEKQLKTTKFLFWDHNTVKYYKRISDVLKHLTKNEILKEFGVKFSVKTSFEEDAIKIKQENNSMYLLGMHPGLLLKMAYVYRRTGKKPGAYQRIINKDRIDSISKFFNESNKLLLPNPVIIVFDDDKEIQDRIEYISKKKILKFPVSYCSAWIIDGQHRIYGFKDHPNYKDWTGTNDKEDDFKIPTIVFDKLPFIEQNKAFVDINYYQKKIDAVLFNDLATVIQDLKHEITWVSLLIAKLNKTTPWKNMIRISELDTGKPITISGFAKTKLLYSLLGYDKKKNTYSGILYNIAPFDTNKPFANVENQKAFTTHINILNRFFRIIRKKVKDNDPTKDKWLNNKVFGLTKFTCVNALILVLKSLLEKDPKLSINLDKWLTTIDVIDFRNEQLLKYGRGYPAMPKIANKIIRSMNSRYKAKLKLV